MPPRTVIAKSGPNLSGDKLTVDFIDTGQGNAVLVSYPNGNFMLVDCGSQATSTKGRTFTHVSSYITRVTGGKTIDCVVLSHGDEDHTAFVPSITEAATPTYVHYGGSISDYSTAVRTWINQQENKKNRFVYRYPQNYSMPMPDADFATETTKGKAWTMVLAANYGGSPNSRSIVLMIRFGSHAVILPGDAEADTEAFIVKNVPRKLLAGCTVLMPGHHGAVESTSSTWTNVLTPPISVVSASGTNMSYAHPSCVTMETLKLHAQAGANEHQVICSTGKGVKYTRDDNTQALLTTATNGDVRFISDGSNWRLLASSVKALLSMPQPAHPVLRQLVANAPWHRPPLERSRFAPYAG